MKSFSREGTSTVSVSQKSISEWDTDDWRLSAACRDTSPDLFFPVGVTGMAADQIEAAKVVCRQCPVLAACLEFALTTNQEAGIWGATTEDERHKLRRVWLAQRRDARAGHTVGSPAA